MQILLRDAQQSDIPFMSKMLYEAVFWRDSANRPSFEDGLAYPEVSKSLANWGEREGDTGVVVTVNSIPVGAAWYRLWTDNNFINGYIDENIPVLVIGVHGDYRQRGIGKILIKGLVDRAAMKSLPRLSLSVSKDNYAINLYKQQGFVEYVDNDDAFIMVCDVAKESGS